MWAAMNVTDWEDGVLFALSRFDPNIYLVWFQLNMKYLFKNLKFNNNVPQMTKARIYLSKHFVRIYI